MDKQLLALGRLRLTWSGLPASDHLLSDRLAAHAKRPEPLSLLDPSTGWYQPWYFGLRLAEEIARSRRYDFELSLIGLSLPDFDGPLSPRRFELNAALVRLTKELRLTDLPGVIDEGHLALALPQTARDGAKLVQQRLADALAPYEVQFGLAVCPSDAWTSELLIKRGFEQAEQGQSWAA